MGTITFVTGNEGKRAEVEAILSTSSPNATNKDGFISVSSMKLDLPELQGKRQEIAIEKCRRAAEIVDGPVLTEDTSLCFDALNELPGPYIKWFLEDIGHVGLNKMLDGFDCRKAAAICTMAFSLGKGQPVILFEGKTRGEIVLPRGPPNSFGWDPIFQPLDCKETYAEMSKSDKNKISHRFKALQLLQAYLNAHPILQTA